MMSQRTNRYKIHVLLLQILRVQSTKINAGLIHRQFVKSYLTMF